MKIDLFSTPIFISNIDLNKIIIKNGAFEKTWLSETNSSHNNGDILDEESSKYLLGKIGSLIANEVKKDLKIKLDQIWENRYTDKDFQERHNHPGSHFSFIIYKKITEPKTIFINPNEDLILSYFSNLHLSLFQQNFKPECREGQMVIFPSFLHHMVSKTNESITIAGNISLEEVK
tara:strand:+ start:327 stop:854 length:528 start_codon:yes stop_codon:yes gene_type:complete